MNKTLDFTSYIELIQLKEKIGDGNIHCKTCDRTWAIRNAFMCNNVGSCDMVEGEAPIDYAKQQRDSINVISNLRNEIEEKEQQIKPLLAKIKTMKLQNKQLLEMATEKHLNDVHDAFSSQGVPMRTWLNNGKLVVMYSDTHIEKSFDLTKLFAGEFDRVKL